jgi:ribonucleoside-diphosphate reductase alpha chain
MLAEYVFKSKYARYNAEAGRRETWSEAVKRTAQMHRARFPHEAAQIDEVEGALERREILPSMRGLQFAGAGVTRKNMRLYNCTSSYCDRPRFFAEALWLLLAGSGVGFSVQRHHTDKLPPISAPMSSAPYTVADSIEGWADATHALISAYMSGAPRPLFDFSQVRPAGSPLSVGGTAPGPEPLRLALEGIEQVLRGAEGRRLRPIEAFDCAMYLADCTRTAGTRRSATIAIFDADDEEMITAKTAPEWYITHPHRARANISAVITPDTPRERYSELFRAARTYGEPGLVYLDSTEWAVNPCVEILMCPTHIKHHGEQVERYTVELLNPARRAEWEAQGYRFESGWSACNLSTVNVAAARDAAHLAELARLASRLGTYQASYTDTGYLGATSRAIIEREALLGVSLCGMAARPDLTLDAETLEAAARAAVQENADTAARIGTRQASRVTCVKPEGTASLVLGTSSGIHPAHARRYLRRVQASERESVFQAYRAANPLAVEKSAWGSDYAAIFACEGRGTTRDELTALDLLARARVALSAWVKPGTARPQRLVGACHNVSLTVSVQPDEWEAVEADLWEHRASYRGVSLLGASGDYDYPQAPFQAIYTDEEIDAMNPTAERRAAMIEARALWERIKRSAQPVDYEAQLEGEDTTAPLAVDACAGGMCELK